MPTALNMFKGLNDYDNRRDVMERKRQYRIHVQSMKDTEKDQNYTVGLRRPRSF